MRDFIVARSWRTFDKQQLVALTEICKIIVQQERYIDNAEIHLNINNPNHEMQAKAFQLLPPGVSLFFYDNAELEQYVRDCGIEPDIEKYREWEWIYHIILHHKLYHERGNDYVLTYDDDILFNDVDFSDIVHFVTTKIPFSIADQFVDADKPMMGKLIEKFGNELFENYYRCHGNDKSGNSGFMGFNNSTMSLFTSKEDFQWLINSFIYKRWDHMTMQGTSWDTYKVLIQEQSLLSILNRAYSNTEHIILLHSDGYILTTDMELMKQSKIMHFISTTKYSEEYTQLIENKYTILQEVFKI
jgi:hypothetical protein